jgi:hypothetical protein
LLLIFCEGGRPTESGKELMKKFGCGDPFELPMISCGFQSLHEPPTNFADHQKAEVDTAETTYTAKNADSRALGAS